MYIQCDQHKSKMENYIYITVDFLCSFFVIDFFRCMVSCAKFLRRLYFENLHKLHGILLKNLHTLHGIRYFKNLDIQITWNILSKSGGAVA